MRIPVVETERLILREFREDDFERFAEMKADPEVMRYISDGNTLSAEVAWRLMSSEIGHWELNGFGHWAVQERGSRAFIGQIGLYEPLGWPGLEAGWQLHRSAWGKGYATEGAEAALQFAWRKLGAEHVISLIQAENTASIKVAEKIGESLEGTLNFHGHEVQVYGIDRPEAAFGDMLRIFRGWKSRRKWRDWRESESRNSVRANQTAYRDQLLPPSGVPQCAPEAEEGLQLRPIFRRWLGR